MEEESSRICVKQLSKFMTEPKLREIFSKIGTVTDLKIVKTKDGRPRGFGFVGFKTAEEARLAVRRLNKSYIGGGRIGVELARAVGDGALPRPWSKYTPGSSKYAQIHGVDPSAPGEAAGDASRGGSRDQEEDPTGVRSLVPHDDPLYREFAGVMGKGDGSKSTWSNADAGRGAAAAKGGGHAAAAAADAQLRASRQRAPGGAGDSESEGSSSGESSGSSDSDSSSSGDSGSSSDSSQDSDSDSEDEEEASEGGGGGLSSANMAFLSKLKGKGAQTVGGSVDADGSGSGSDREKGAAQGSASDNDSESESDSEEEEEEEGGDFQVVDGELQPAKKQKGKKRSRKEMGSGGSDSGGDSGEEGVKGGESGATAIDESRLFVRNLPYAATEADVRKHFGGFGDVSEVVVPRDGSGKGKGICFVSFEEPAIAAKAMHGTDGRVFMGRLVHVMPARPAPTAAPGFGGSGGFGDDAEGAGDRRRVGQSSYKAELEAKRKEAARSGRESNVWNTLLVRSDVALSSAAKAAGAAEDEVMDKTASNPAVRLALGETAVIEETKGFLRQEGVDLDLLEQGLKGLPITRSDSVILVKQLPPDVEREAVRSLFSRFGPLVRCVMPPAKSICLVEFEMPRAAKKAFRSLAYTRFMRVPLYLEWAPDRLFDEGAGVSARSQGAADAGDVEAEDDGAAAGRADSASGETADSSSGTAEGSKAAPAASSSSSAALPAAVEGKTLFVKNLAFATTQERLKELADTVGKTRAVHIPTRSERRGGKDVVLSMGYGFVEYNDKADALEAIKRLQGAMLDGHSIELKLSKKKAGPSAAHRASASAAVKDEKDGKTGVGQGSKLLVKNLAFEATRQDLRELFGAFGKLQSVRVPRRHDGQHRGFGFVDFASAEDARTAADKLASTHLYGRKLVIAWPNVESEEATAQRKAAAGPGGSGQRRKAGAAFGVAPRGASGGDGDRASGGGEARAKKKRRVK